tara:strand:+ start:22126 stop:22248 length:123 start_codon:yes stop_codon:yes gene_type:complete
MKGFLGTLVKTSQGAYNANVNSTEVLAKIVKLISKNTCGE